MPPSAETIYLVATAGSEHPWLAAVMWWVRRDFSADRSCGQTLTSSVQTRRSLTESGGEADSGHPGCTSPTGVEGDRLLDVRPTDGKRQAPTGLLEIGAVGGERPVVVEGFGRLVEWRQTGVNDLSQDHVVRVRIDCCSRSQDTKRPIR